jgi:formylmethanofuran dehydrogenase subunit B
MQPGLPDRQNEPREAPGPGVHVFSDFDMARHARVCTGCSCLCDDISFFFKDGKILGALNICETGWRHVRGLRSDAFSAPSPPVFSTEQVEQAARLLSSQRPTLVLGADGLDEAAIRVSRELAVALNGAWLPWPYPEARRFYDRVRRFGWATALLDEVRDQADLVIFWRVDPLETHHRHLSRYSLFARGRFTERGRQDRNLAAVSSYKMRLEPLCQQYFQMLPEQDAPLIEALMPTRLEGIFDHRDFPPLRRALQGASYVALFVDPGATDDAALDGLFQWSRALNETGSKRHVILPLWRAGANFEGFCQVSLEHEATPWGKDGTGTGDKANETGYDWDSIAARIHSVLVIASGQVDNGHLGLPECLREKPRVVLDPFGQACGGERQVCLPTAVPGVESGGVFFRADGLCLEVESLEGVCPFSHPSAERLLREILYRIT